MAAAWACCMGMAAAWACCCFKTGMHGAWHAAASKPGCMVHGMSLQQQQLLRACMRACVAAFVIDTIYELTRRRRPGRGESNFRIEIFAKVRHGQKGELGKQLPELTLLSASINLEYFYTEIRFSTPGSAPTCQLVYGVDHAGSHPRTHACTQQL